MFLLGIAKPLAPKLHILPPQLRLWPELAGVPEPFVLYGGTALALHLGHRDSVDFDFFSDREFDVDALLQQTPFLTGSLVVQREPNTLTWLVDRGGSVKISFCGFPNVQRLREPLVCAENGLRVASMDDLAATNVVVVQNRAKAKDNRDIDALLTAGIPLARALAAAKLVYGSGFAPTPTLKALTYFGDGDLPSLPPDVKERLAKASADVDPLRLPSLSRTTGRGRSGDRSR